MAALVERAVRAAKLDAAVYEEVEADAAALGQATTVVVVSSIAFGIGGAVAHGIVGLIMGAVGALVGWYIWAFLTYIVGTKILPESQTEADFGQLLRTIGFSSAPGVLHVLGVVPAIGPIISFLVSVWMLAAMVVAVRQALDYTSTARAVGVCLIGWLVQLLVVGGLLFLVGPHAMSPA